MKVLNERIGNMHLKRFLAKGLVVLTFASLVLTGTACFAQESANPTLAPENPAFLQYIQNSGMITQESISSPPGLVPEPFELPQFGGFSLFADIPNTVALPTSYDLRPLSKLTPIRNQGSCGSCWAFASVGSLESSFMPGESLDFSENNLKNLAGYDISCCSGGNRTMSTGYFARWAGPIFEANDPYNTGSCSSPTLVPTKHLQEVIYLPVRSSSTDNDAIKQAVMTYGAVYTTYYHSDSYYNSTTKGYYFNSSTSANHAVCIVGWDDSFSRNNFRTAAPGDGAFLIRNSWGTYWGNAGYFWMSYYDTVLGRTENAVFRGETNNYDAIYQYDTLGWTSNTGYGTSTAWFANVFTATSNSSLAAASWYSSAPNSTYELYFYLNPTSGPISSSGPVATKTGTIATAGYHTIALDSPVAITAGQKFSVVVKVNTPGYSYPVPLERPISGYCSRATASAGQSYISSSGTSWSDITNSYANTNVCLKAFTSKSSTPTPGTLSVSPSTSLSSTGYMGGPFSPTSASYTLTNTGGSSIDWAAGNSQTWTTLSATSGTLAAGATATVIVSINSNASILTVGSYADNITFNNVTNGNGNAVRTVSLSVRDNTPTPGALSVTPSTGLNSNGNAGGPFSPTSATYTLINTGGTSINWTASDTQTWTSLSATGGTLAAGATTTVTVSINSNANTLVAGTYSDTVTLTNTTKGTGNTTRGVTLSVGSSTPPPPSGAYRVERTTYSWIDPTYHTRIQLGDNTCSTVQAMPFTFNFYGTNYSNLYVSSNGILSFSSAGMTNYSNYTIPYMYSPNAGIYPYWDNLNAAAGGNVRIGTIGSAPNRKLVISWVGVPHYNSLSTTFTFQAILCEGTNDMIFQYQNVTPGSIYGGGRSATIGIEDQTGKSAVKWSYNIASVSNGMALRFTTQPTTAVTKMQRFLLKK